MKNDIPAVRRTGPVPFWRGEERIRERLEAIYRKAMAKASEL